MWRVLRHKGNALARNALLRNAVFFFGSFVVTMGAALILFDLNADHCVFNMTQTSADGSVAVICNPSE